MEFRLDEGQVELQETVARFCAARYPLDGVVAREGAPLDRAVWSELAELGVLGLLAAEADGGSGLGALEGAIVFEQLGAHLVPGPLLWTVLAAGLVEGAAAGDVVVGGVAASAVVDGTALVEHAADLDVLIVVHDDAVVSHRATDLPAPVALEPLDPLTPVGRVTGLTGGEVIGDARGGRAAPAARHGPQRRPPHRPRAADRWRWRAPMPSSGSSSMLPSGRSRP